MKVSEQLTENVAHVICFLTIYAVSMQGMNSLKGGILITLVALVTLIGWVFLVWRPFMGYVQVLEDNYKMYIRRQYD